MAKEIIFGIAASDKATLAMAPAELVFTDGTKATMPVHRFLGTREEMIENITKIINSFYEAETKIATV